MTARDALTDEQRKWLADFALRQLQTITPVRDRLEKILPADDPLMRDIHQVYDAIHGLRVRTAYLTMDRGSVGG